MKDQNELLESYGWTIECESPFEIFHDETGSRATGIAVDCVIESCYVEKTRGDDND